MNRHATGVPLRRMKIRKTYPFLDVLAENIPDYRQKETLQYCEYILRFILPERNLKIRFFTGPVAECSPCLVKEIIGNGENPAGIFDPSVCLIFCVVHVRFFSGTYLCRKKIKIWEFLLPMVGHTRKIMTPCIVQALVNFFLF